MDGSNSGGVNLPSVQAQAQATGKAKGHARTQAQATSQSQAQAKVGVHLLQLIRKYYSVLFRQLNLEFLPLGAPHNFCRLSQVSFK